MDKSSIQSNFFNTNIGDFVTDYLTPNNNLEEDGFNIALNLFKQAAQRVPAYKDFLKKNKINPDTIRTIADFKNIPIVDKKNYLRAYPLKDLCWNGSLESLYILSSSSGSTGEPFLWPRGEEQELEGGLNFEVIFKTFFAADKLTTLYINCFAMGTWIAGPFVLACAEYLTRKGYKVMTVTPGLEKEVMFSLFKNLAPQFDQIVISGYPPLVKDLLDVGQDFDIDWKKYKIKFLFAAEGFSEKWREYIYDKVGAKDYLTSSINLYGSADAAILSFETPLAIAIRRSAGNNPKKIEKLFNQNRIPTLTQYDPRLKFFEEIDGSIVFTTRSGLPLIRYGIGDNGGVCSYQEMEERVGLLGLDMDKLLNQKEKKYLWKLPFAYVFGRKDFTVSLYGLLIYPEHIKYGLENSSLSKYVSGKFVMSIENDSQQNPYLLVRVELKNHHEGSDSLNRKIVKCIIEGLKNINSEYHRLIEAVKERAVPVVELVENGNFQYFKPGAKQKWVKKA